MALISFSTITDGTTATASQVNTPLSTIYNDYNGNITDANIAAGAAIAGSKISLATISNPYKFSVYRNAALSTANAVVSVITYDTKLFDTGSNVDIVTNKGRFTAPIAGFYYFSAGFDAVVTTDNQGMNIYLYKNGSEFDRGNMIAAAGNGNIIRCLYSNLLQLAAGDYVEIFSFGSGIFAMETGATSPHPTFSGFLVSAT